MSSMCGGGGNSTLGHKRVHHFTYDSVATFFNAVPQEVKNEIQVFESQDGGDCPYHLDFELIGEDSKWVLDLGKSRSRKLHFLNSLTLHQ